MEKQRIIHILILVSIAIVALLSHEYLFFSGDNSVYLPLIYHVQDPTLFPSEDPFMQHLTTQPYYVYWLLGFLARWIDLELFSFVGYLACLVIIAWAMFEITMTLTSQRELGYLAALLAVNWRGFTLGGFDILMPSFVQHTISIALLICSLLFFIRQKRSISMIFLTLSFYAHVLNALLFFGLLVVVDLIAQRDQWRSFFPAYGIVGVATSPIILLTLQHRGSGFFTILPGYIDFLNGRVAHHLFPQTWGLHLIGFLIFLLVAGFCLQRIQSRYRSLVIAFGVGTLVAALVATFCSVIFPFPAILRLYPFRTTLFLKMVLIPVFAIVLGEQAYHHWPSFGLLLAAAADQAYLFGAMAVLWLIFDLFWSPVSGIVILGEDVLKYLQGTKEFFLVLAGIVAAFCCQTENRRRYLVALFLGVILLSGIFHFQENLKNGDFQYPHQSRTDPSLKLFAWARTSSSHESRFLVPPSMTFGSFAQRLTFVEHKNCAQGVFDQQYGLACWDRLRQLGCIKNGDPFRQYSSTACLQAYGNLTSTQIISLAEKYHITYVVFPVTTRLPFTPVFRDEEWIVYRLP